MCQFFSTFYVRLFWMKVSRELSCTYILDFNFFWHKDIGANALIKCWWNWPHGDLSLRNIAFLDNLTITWDWRLVLSRTCFAFGQWITFQFPASTKSAPFLLGPYSQNFIFDKFSIFFKFQMDLRSYYGWKKQPFYLLFYVTSISNDVCFKKTC